MQTARLRVTSTMRGRIRSRISARSTPRLESSVRSKKAASSSVRSASRCSRDSSVSLSACWACARWSISICSCATVLSSSAVRLRTSRRKFIGPQAGLMCAIEGGVRLVRHLQHLQAHVGAFAGHLFVQGVMNAEMLERFGWVACLFIGLAQLQMAAGQFAAFARALLCERALAQQVFDCRAAARPWSGRPRRGCAQSVLWTSWAWRCASDPKPLHAASQQPCQTASASCR